MRRWAAWPRSWPASTTRCRASPPPPTVDGLRDLAAAATRAPEPLRALLQQLAEHDAGLAFTALREPWGRQLASDVVPACTQAIDGRYPFVRQATQEMTREEFVRTFGAGGVLDGFFQRTLAPWVDTGVRPWTVRALPQAKVGDALLPFQRAHHDPPGVLPRRRPAVRRAHGAAAARARPQHGRAADRRRRPELALRPRQPHAADAAAGRDPGAGRVQLQATAPGGAAGATYAFEGPWALLRLFDRVRVEPGSSSTARCWCSTSKAARRASRRTSPQGALAILLPELEQFQCPRRL